MDVISKEKAPPQSPPQPPPRRPALRIGDLFKPHAAVPRRIYLGTVIFSLALIFIIWSILTYGGFIHPSYFLPSPTAVISAGIKMIQTGELWENAQASIFVVVVGWVIAAVLAVPIGILMGSLKIFEALVEPVVDFVRYLPVSALIPLLILYIGLGVEEKISVIFIGTFFQLVLLVADVAAHVANDLLDSAYTLGASRIRVLTTVLLPATLPGVMDALRITLGWAWTYLIVAELVAAERGLGIMILQSQRGLRTDKIFVGLVTIGLLGFACDILTKWLHRRLLPWSPRIH
jgi:NitT/TauT family transport system permease protein